MASAGVSSAHSSDSSHSSESSQSSKSSESPSSGSSSGSSALLSSSDSSDSSQPLESPQFSESPHGSEPLWSSAVPHPSSELGEAFSAVFFWVAALSLGAGACAAGGVSSSRSKPHSSQKRSSSVHFAPHSGQYTTRTVTIFVPQKTAEFRGIADGGSASGTLLRHDGSPYCILFFFRASRGHIPQPRYMDSLWAALFRHRAWSSQSRFCSSQSARIRWVSRSASLLTLSFRLAR